MPVTDYDKLLQKISKKEEHCRYIMVKTKKMSQKIFLKSAKGGAGATTVAAGLGFALSSAGERTLIVDGDSDSACALNVCGCADLQVFTVADYKKGACRAKQATLQHPKYKNTKIYT